MPAPWAHGVDVTVLRASTTIDRYGNTVPAGWVEVGVLEGCGVAPRESVEDNTNRTAVVVGLTVFAAPGVDVRADDRCQIGAVVYEVDGKPAVWSHPMTGWQPGTVIQLRDVEG